MLEDIPIELVINWDQIGCSSVELDNGKGRGKAC